MSSVDTPTGPGASSPLQQLRLPRFRKASQQVPSFEHVLAPSVSQQGSPVQPQPDNPSQFQRSSHGVNFGPLFRPHQAGPEPNTLDVMEHIHGRPRLMSQLGLHYFCIAYDVPLGIASDMRALSMIGVYPSSLIYLLSGFGKYSRTVALELRNCNTTTILGSPFVPQTRPTQRTCRTRSQLGTWAVQMQRLSR
jgi:hypothetical protein